MQVQLSIGKLFITGLIFVQTESFADTIDMNGQEPYERCGFCHEYDGNSRMPGFPSLAGQTKDYIHKQLLDFRSGKRLGTMQSIAEILSDSEIEAVAEYFSGQQTTTPPIDKKVDISRGEEIYFRGKQQPFVPACANCHGKGGEGMNSNPRLARQLPDYIYKQMHSFKEAKRRNDQAAVMRNIARNLDSNEIESLAGFLASMPELKNH